VVDAARVVAEHGGVDAITMANVANELGVTPMALYQHVSDKEHLLTLLLELQLDPVVVQSTGPWDERLRDLHLQVTDAMARFPGLTHHVPEPAAVARLLDAYLQILMDAGFDDRTAALAYTGLYYLAVGAQYPYHGVVTPAAEPPSDATFEATARAAAVVGDATRAELQQFALDAYLDGLRQLLRERRDI